MLNNKAKGKKVAGLAADLPKVAELLADLMP